MKFLLLSFILLVSVESQAQIYKTYFDETGAIVLDSTLAKTYHLSILNNDSLWASKGFDMQNNLLISGTFIDKELSIGHGVFKFYGKQSIRFNSKMDTLSRDTSIYLREVGVLENGRRVGEWNDFFIDGRLEFTSNYKEGVLEGLSVSYSYDSQKPYIEGNYVNGKKDGNWNSYTTRGELSQTNIYKYGKVIKTLYVPTSYRNAEITDKFLGYIKKNLSDSLLRIIRHRAPGFLLKLSAEGKVTGVSGYAGHDNIKNSEGPGFTYPLPTQEEIIEAIRELEKLVLACSVLCQPAYDAKISKAVEGEAWFTIDQHKGWLEVKKY